MALPTYTSHEQIDVTPNPGSGAAWDTLGKLFGNVEQKFTAIRQQQNQEAAEANKYLTQADVIQNVGRIYNEAQQNPNAEDALKQFTSSAAGYSNGVLQSTPSSNKPYVTYLLASQTQSKLNALNSKLATQNKAAADGAWTTTFQTTLNEAQNMNATDPSNPNTKIMNAQIPQMIDTAASLGLIDGKQSAIYKLNADKQLTSSSALGNYNRLIQSGKVDEANQYKQSFLESNNDIYSPTEKMAIEGHMDAFQQLQAQNEGITKQTVNNTLKSVVLRAQETGNGPTPQEESTLQIGNPTEWPNTKNTIAAAQLQNGLVQSNANGTLGQMQQGIAKLSQPLSPQDLASPNANLLQGAKQGAVAALTKNIKQWNTDPAQATQEDPNFQTRAAQLQTQIVSAQPTLQNNDPNPLYQAQQAHLAQAQDQLALDLQTTKGIAPNKMSLITSGDAANLVSQIRQLPMAQQMQALTQEKQRYGSNSQYVFPQLAKAGLPIATTMLVSMQNNPQSAAMIPTAIQAFSTPKKDLEASLPAGVKSNDVLNRVKNNLSDYISSLQGYAGLSSSSIDNIYAQTHQVALQLIRNGESPNQAAHDAANTMVNNHYDYNTFAGHTYRVPTTIPSNMVQSAANYLKNSVAVNPDILNNVRVPDYFYANLAPDVRRDLYLREGVSQGYIVTNMDDSGITFVDRYGTPVTDKTGKPFSILFSDITNPSSDFSKNMANTTKEGQAQLNIKNQFSRIYQPLSAGDNGP